MSCCESPGHKLLGVLESLDSITTWRRKEKEEFGGIFSRQHARGSEAYSYLV